MKKNKNLVIGVIIVLLLAAVAAWYFFFRTPAALKVGDEVITDPVEPIPGPLDQFVCPVGTSGTYPDCTLDVVNANTIFSNAITAAKLNVTNNVLLTTTQKVNAISVIDVYVPKNKDVLLADAASGRDLVTLILQDAEKIYLTNYGVYIALIAGSGKG